MTHASRQPSVRSVGPLKQSKIENPKSKIEKSRYSFSEQRLFGKALPVARINAQQAS